MLAVDDLALDVRARLATLLLGVAREILHLGLLHVHRGLRHAATGHAHLRLRFKTRIYGTFPVADLGTIESSNDEAQVTRFSRTLSIVFAKASSHPLSKTNRVPTHATVVGR